MSERALTGKKMQSWSRHNSAVFLAMVIPPVCDPFPKHGTASVVSVDVMREWHQVQALLLLDIFILYSQIFTFLEIQFFKNFGRVLCK